MSGKTNERGFAAVQINITEGQYWALRNALTVARTWYDERARFLMAMQGNERTADQYAYQAKELDELIKHL